MTPVTGTIAVVSSSIPNLAEQINKVIDTLKNTDNSSRVDSIIYTGDKSALLVLKSYYNDGH